MRNSSNSTSGYLSKESKHVNPKRYLHPHVHAALFTIAKTRTNLSVHQWVNGYINCGIHIPLHTHINKNEILPFATIWIDLKGIMLSAIVKQEKYCKPSNVECKYIYYTYISYKYNINSSWQFEAFWKVLCYKWILEKMFEAKWAACIRTGKDNTHGWE